MDREIKEIMAIATSIVMFSVTLLATVGFYTIGAEFRNKTLQKKSISEDIKESSFISNMSNSIVNGSDITNFMIKYKDKYTYVIIDDKPEERSVAELNTMASKNRYLYDADYYNTDIYLKNISKNILNVYNDRYLYLNKYLVVNSLNDIRSSINAKVYGDKTSDWSQDNLDKRIGYSEYIAKVVKKNGALIFVYFKVS